MCVYFVCFVQERLRQEQSEKVETDHDFIFILGQNDSKFETESKFNRHLKSRSTLDR